MLVDKKPKRLILQKQRYPQDEEFYSSIIEFIRANSELELGDILLRLCSRFPGLGYELARNCKDFPDFITIKVKFYRNELLFCDLHFNQEDWNYDHFRSTAGKIETRLKRFNRGHE